MPLICYVLPRTAYAGTERHVLELAAGLRDRGLKTQILCVFDEGALAEEVRRLGIPFDCLHAGKSWGLSTAWMLGRWLRSHPVDILHTYLFGFHAFAGVPARLSKIPAILSSRREIPLWMKLCHRWLENFGDCFVDRVVCCSEAVREWTREHEWIRSDKLLTIHNGVDCDYFQSRSDGSELKKRLGIPPGAPVVGTVANFGKEKDYPTLLEAAQKVMAVLPSAWFLFAGDGPQRGATQKQAAMTKAGGRILFTGSQPDVRGFLEAMDVFVLASSREGFPNVLLQAMAMAKPIVATNVGGIPEALRPGLDGLLVEPKDSEALAQGILWMLRDASRARQVGLTARERAQKTFSLANMLDRYENLYRELARKR